MVDQEKLLAWIQKEQGLFCNALDSYSRGVVTVLERLKNDVLDGDLNSDSTE